MFLFCHFVYLFSLYLNVFALHIRYTNVIVFIRMYNKYKTSIRLSYFSSLAAFFTFLTAGCFVNSQMFFSESPHGTHWFPSAAAALCVKSGPIPVRRLHAAEWDLTDERNETEEERIDRPSSPGNKRKHQLNLIKKHRAKENKFKFSHV